MNDKIVRFPFCETDNKVGNLPYLPLVLNYRNHSLAVKGILDTGSTVNVLPYEVGIKLGLIWEQQTTRVKLTGNLTNLEARAIIMTATVRNFFPVKFAFAWTQVKNVPLILGQMNFFLEFDVCFYGSQSVFEITPKKLLK